MKLQNKTWLIFIYATLKFNNKLGSLIQAEHERNFEVQNIYDMVQIQKIKFCSRHVTRSWESWLLLFGVPFCFSHEPIDIYTKF